MPEKECNCGPDGIDAKCVHLGDGAGVPVPSSSCCCYACQEARGGPKVKHVSDFEKRKRATKAE